MKTKAVKYMTKVKQYMNEEFPMFGMSVYRFPHRKTVTNREQCAGTLTIRYQLRAVYMLYLTISMNGARTAISNLFNNSIRLDKRKIFSYFICTIHQLVQTLFCTEQLSLN